MAGGFGLPRAVERSFDRLIEAIDAGYPGAAGRRRRR
jgi:hypothetical protein